MKSLKWKRGIAVLLAMAMVFVGSACHIRPSSERFDIYMEEMFRELAVSDTLTLNYLITDPEAYGIIDPEITFGTVFPQEELEGISWSEMVDQEIQMLQFLFRYDNLTEDQKVTYDYLMHYMETSRLYDGLLYYEEYCLGAGSVVTNLPLMLAEFSFRTREDIETYLSLLSTSGTYFSEILRYEEEKSKQGLFMSDASLDHFEENCQSFLDSGEKNVLLVSFEARIAAFDGLDEATAQGYVTRNANLVEKVVMPAYQTLYDGMEQLRGTGTNQGGIGNLPKGKAYYEFLAAKDVGTDKTVEEMYAALGAAMTKYQTALAALLQKDPELIEKMEAFAVSLSDPHEILQYLQEQMKTDYPEVPEVHYTVKSIADYLSDTNVVAFYIIAPVDDSENHVIYMNDSREFVNSDVFSTLAHEGFPGHLYQTVYFSSKNPDPIRYALRTTGYLEGWATYVENEMYAYSGIEDENLILALQLNNAYNMLFNAYLDIAVNYENMDYETFKNMLTGMGLGEDVCARAYQAMVEDPGVYLPYAIGYLEFVELREKAETELGAAFDLKEFHTVVLELGSVPFTILKSHVDAYLEQAKLAEAA